MSRPHALLRAGFPYLTTLGHLLMLRSPKDIAIGEEGRLYVLLTDGIRRTNWDDEDLGMIGGVGSGDGQFTWPASIVRDRDENLIVSDEALHRISTLSSEGEFLGSWGEPGDGDGQLNRPSGIALDKDENIYVADTRNHRVQKFTRDGAFQLKWGCHGDGEGQFDMPWGITIDELGDVYVADWRNDRVQKFTADGEFIFELGSTGSGDGQLIRPAGVEVDGDGDIYVADWGNDRVQQFSATGRYVDKFIGDATLGKAAIEYVRSNPKTLRLREMITQEPQKRLREPTSVRLDDEGRMYIVDHLSSRVQVYRKEAYPLEPGEIMDEPKSRELQCA